MHANTMPDPCVQTVLARSLSSPGIRRVSADPSHHTSGSRHVGLMSRSPYTHTHTHTHTLLSRGLRGGGGGGVGGLRTRSRKGYVAKKGESFAVRGTVVFQKFHSPERKKETMLQ